MRSSAGRAGIIVALAASLLAGSNAVKIFKVNPSQGSLAGGTRMHIQGEGFSSPNGPGNVVMIGGYPCITIPLHSTAAQVVCKTTAPPPVGAHVSTSTEYAKSAPSGWSYGIEVKVYTGGMQAECASTDHWGCTFRYHHSSWHTPRIDALEPRDVRPGTILQTSGRFHWTPFGFDKLKAPSMEVPLSSVKIANRALEQQQGQNEPFGQSGTRCALFNAEIEEPFGITGGEDVGNPPSNQWVSAFKCKVNGPREAGRYNLSVALLGIGMEPDSNMYMGESNVDPNALQGDHHGVTYMLQHVPVVTAIFPNVSGTSGGNRITLTGDSFSTENSLVQVSIYGTPCMVETASIEQVVCILAPRASTSPPSGPVPAGRGVRARLWYQVGSTAGTLSNFRKSSSFARSDRDWTEGSLLEMPRDIQNTMGHSTGPAGLFEGFFRAPVGGDVTFLITADDDAELHLARRPNNESDLEQIIDASGGWVDLRDWTTMLVSKGFETNPAYRLRLHRSRTSAKVHFDAGEQRYMEAYYRSSTGGDHLSVGAIFHTATVNRKDRPTAIDDAQLISVNQPRMQLEVANITLSGQTMQGTFRVSAMGKFSRAITVNASALEMTAAVRELLSNCRGSSGSLLDGAGATFDCWQGRGIEYRGLANTHSDGQECKRWDQSPDWYPELVSEVGLTANLCRNPDYNSRGPWCYDQGNSKRACDVPMCGGTETARRAGGGSLVATFEADPEGGASNGLHALSELKGVTPRLDRTTAFCGKASAYMPNTFVDVRSLWKNDKDNSNDIFTKDTPWLCTAYKIPMGTQVNLNVLIRRDKAGGEYGDHVWKVVQLTGNKHSHSTIATMPIQNDGGWHHGCVNIHEALETAAAGGDSDLIQEANHKVTYLRFESTNVAPGAFQQSPFWLDEMSISSTQRIVTQEPDPPYGGSVQVSSVERVATSRGITWLVSLTTETCDAPNVELSLDVSDAINAILVNTTRAMEHTPKATGTLAVNFKGVQTSFSPYASSSEARTALLALPNVGGDIKVERHGTCQAGFDYQVTFTHVPGDQPRLQVSTAQLSDPAISATVTDVAHGGVLVAPLPIDYFHLPGNATVVAIVDESTAVCARHSAGDPDPAHCSFSFDETLNPSIETVVRNEEAATGEFTLTITGDKFSEPFPLGVPAPVPQVTFGGASCGSVTRKSSTRITCQVAPPPLLAPGMYPVEVVIPGRGRAVSDDANRLRWNLTVDEVTPSSINPNAPTILTVHGAGFYPTLAKNEFVFEGNPCAPKTVNATQLTCLYYSPGSNAGSSRRLLGASLSITVDNVLPPNVTALDPVRGSAAGGDLLTVFGGGFSTTMADNTVTIGGIDATVTSASTDDITVQTPPGVVGEVQVLVTVASRGTSAATNASAFRYFLSVTGVSPTTGGLAGGARVTVDGEGLVSAAGVKGTVSVLLSGTEVYVVGLYSADRIPAGNVTGEWTLSLGGVTTQPLNASASEEEVLDEVSSAFPSLSDVQVVSYDGVPGPFLNRFYPRQWEIRFSRLKVAGPGVDRCTNPLYVDWDPDACPAAAADLFLHHYPWYYPSGLPKPADLGEAPRKAALLQQCAAEAVSKGLRPGTCNALVPSETLAMCGVGSGVTPPCWEERFSRAAVTHLDGSRVIYGREDGNSATDTAKGYRAWKREDFAERAAASELRVAGDLSVLSNTNQLWISSVQIHAPRRFSRGAESVRVTDVTGTASQLTGLLPDMSPYAMRYQDLLDFEALDSFSARIVVNDASFASPPSGALFSGVTLAAPALLPSKLGAASLSFPRNISAEASFPYSPSYNPPDAFSLDLWIRAAAPQGNTGMQPVVRSEGPASGTGYALEITSARRWRFRVGLGAGAFAAVESASAVPSPGVWVHVAATFDGVTLRLHVSGALAGERMVTASDGSFTKNPSGPLVLGGGGAGYISFEGEVDEVVVYGSAISEGRARSHAEFSSRIIGAAVLVSFGSATSACIPSSACTFNPSASLTPRVQEISPARGWAGTSVTISGAGFAPSGAGAATVAIGTQACTVTSITDSVIVCDVGGEPPAGEHAVAVTVPNVGVSVGDVRFAYTLQVDDLSPLDVSTEGGATITLSGWGLPSDVSRLSISVGGVPCSVPSAASCSSTACMCVMAARVSLDGYSLPVVVSLDAVLTECTAGDGCAVRANATVTPEISALSSSQVTTGDTLTISQDDDEFLEDTPVVMIGEAACSVTVANTSFVTCTVTGGEGGYQRLWVRYPSGYAKGGACCSRVTRPVTISSLAPAAGSTFGGQRLTLTGAGFSSMAMRNRVTVSGRRARVETTGAAPTTQLVVVTSPQGGNTSVADGEERAAWRGMASCLAPRGERGECVARANLTGCAAGLLGEAHASSNPGRHWVRTHPGGDELPSAGALGDAALIDGEESTVWCSRSGEDRVLVAIDLGAVKVLSGVVVKFAGRASAGSVAVFLGDACDTLPDRKGQWTRGVGEEWDTAADVVLETGASGRWLVLELQGRGARQGGFAVRDVVAVGTEDADARGVSVEVNGLASTCGGSDCAFAYSSSPSVMGVSPISGAADDTLVIYGQGFASDCSRNIVGVGGAACAVDSCTTSEITCTLAAQAAGTYPVTVSITGEGYASSEANFTYTLLLSDASPSSVGLGGGLAVTITGKGFSPAVDGTRASVCSAPCRVTSSSTSELVCVPGAAIDFAAASGVGGRDRTQDIAVRGGGDDAAEDVRTGAISASDAALQFSFVYNSNDDRSLEEVYLRFAGVNVAQGSNVSDARLLVKAADNHCKRGVVLYLWAEASDDSPAFLPGKRGSLTARARTGGRMEWVQEDDWNWFGESQESLDISALVNEVSARPGWRAGNSMTVIVRMKATNNAGSLQKACAFLSRDSGTEYAARLRIQTPDAPLPTLPSSLACDVTVSAMAAAPLPASDAARCSARLTGVKAEASSSEFGRMYKDVYPKIGDHLTWNMARDVCASQGLQLCTKDEIMSGPPSPIGDPRPFWDTDIDPPFSVPVAVEHYGNHRVYSGSAFLEVPTMLTSWPSWAWSANGENKNKTSVTPCCGSAGHSAMMAVDMASDTYWQSLGTDAAPTITLDLGPAGARIHRVELQWEKDYHPASYSIEARPLAGSTYTLLHPPPAPVPTGNSEGNSEAATVVKATPGEEGVTLFGEGSETSFRYVRIRMTSARPDGKVGIREVKMEGCGLERGATEEAAGSLVAATLALTPTVTSVMPSRGSTAGGTDITIRGAFLGDSVEITFGTFRCNTTSAITTSSGEDEITCRTSASGTTNGGMKHVVVRAEGFGDSLPGGNASFWYVDTWSARTTWGGAAPPTGCGSWLDDPNCDDSVVIPEGQIVLLDQSLPRFYLILVMGTLIFDRKDISIGASYILVNGGTLQIGTEADPFMQQAHITLYGHPKSIDLPVFGAKVIACYECTLDIHGAPQVSWTTLAETAMPGATSIKLMQPVEWPVGSKIAIATTDFESPHSSHTEVAQVESITESGTRVNLRDTRVCHEYSNSGLPKTCKHTSDGALTYPHLGEELVLGGRTVAFRAEVGLLSRNIVVEGDYDARLCPLADLADDGVTRLSCNQFGAQIFLSSPGHESLIGRMSNMEIRNGGQAFRLGRYAIHWHMIGNVKQSFQKNCSIHHSWNRGVAIHGVHFLLLRGNFAYHAMGHTFFIEDGVEHYNRLEGNLAIKTIPSMNLLNTDQTPACFWIVTGVNYVINNHAVASRRYGFWFRPERTVTGTSVNTPMKDHPINIPVLEFRGNQAHSNGKYGLRVFDIFKPNEASVFQDTFVWRNGKAGFTATVVGKVGFDGMIAVQNGHVVFEGRENYVESWDENYIRNALFVDWVPLPLAESFGIFEDNFQAVEALGGPMEEGILLPWNNQPGGGMSISNVTFVNFKNACIRGCAHCGRGGSPYFGDGAFETRFDQMTFINSSERVLFRHPNEAYFHDLDGSLTGTGIVESYTRGGTVRGASFVGTSPLLPPGACTPSAYSSHGTGGSVCEGHIFKRMWYHPKTPETWVGKALCVRPTHQHRVQVDTCQTLQAECNCLPYLKKKWKGHVWLAAEGERYNVFQDLQTYELADIVSFSMNMWDVAPMEDFQISHKFLEWEAADRFGRPMYWQDGGNFNGNQRYPVNYNFNASELAAGTYGTLKRNTAWASVDADAMAIYVMGNASAGDLAVPMPDTPNFEYAVVPDSDGYGAVHTLQIRGRSSGSNVHREGTFQIKPCKRNGCWPPPPAPPPPPPDNFFSLWSAESTWANLTGHAANPLNVLKEIPLGRRRFAYTVKEQQNWNSSVPSHYDNVWIPSWKKVLLDVSTPILGKIVVEGVLVINSTDTISLDAVYIELKGGTLIIAETDIEGNVVGPFQGNCTVTLHGTNLLLSAIHGENPRETPGYVVGKEALLMDGGMLGVMGTFIAKGRPVGRSWANLANTSSAGATFVDVAATVAWEMGAEVVVTATDFGVHEAETRRILSTTPLTSGVTRLHLDAPLTFQHFSGEESHGTAGRSIEMRAKVGLLTRNVVIRGEGEGETLPYTQWNSAAGGAPAGAGDCGNGVCQNLENSKSCPADCVGPSYEYGAAILVAGYTEDFVYCSQEQNCESGYRRSFAGHVEMEDVEMRYHGQNNLRPSLRFANLPRKAAKSFVRNVAFNRGYSQVVEIDASSEVAVEWSVSFRSMLPSVRILPAARDAVVNNTLLISSIFWNTHRGAIQGKGLANAKINAMIGAVHVESASAKVLDVVVAGSERSGFSGKGVPCGDALRFQGNEVSASLAGYWYDQTLSPPLKCAAITNLTAWKIYEYGVYAETQGVEELQIVGLRSADARAGVLTILGGGNAIAHVRRKTNAVVSDSLFVGRSESNGACSDKKPGLATCQFYMAWCDHLPLDHVGVYIGSSLSSSNMAPLVFSWSDGGAYAALYGSLAIEDSTFARFETSPCSSTAGVSRKLKTASDRAISSLPPSAGQADSSLSTTTRRLEVSAVPRDAIARMHHPSPSWINQADCIDMDCDGPKHNLIRDVDGTLIGGSGGTILPEAEHFSSKSFFGLPYKDGINFGGQPFWYPNVPAVMRSDMQGFPVNLSATSLRNGYGITREGCTFRDAWMAWECLTPTVYQRLIIENVDADHEIRRVSPVAVTSDDGYTDLLNGAMDHGWCFSYTCLKRLMTFHTIMAVGKTYTVHFTGTNPQTMRLLFPYAAPGEKVLLKIYYQSKSRLQIFLGGEDRAFIEDLNMRDGRRKAQLVRDGKWAPNNDAGTWTDERVALDCASGCKVGNVCKNSNQCSRRGDVHGANIYNRAQGMLEIVVEGHSIDKFLEIRTLPTVQISMGLSVSVDEFYNVKDAFVSNIAAFLGINPSNIAIVDVVPGNARRRSLLSIDDSLAGVDGSEAGPSHARRLLEGEGVTVSFEVVPAAQLDIDDAIEREDTMFMNVTVRRSVNLFEPCSVMWATSDGNGSATAIEGVDFAVASGTVVFPAYESTALLVIEVFAGTGYSETDKIFFVTLGTAVNGTVQDAQALITIQNVQAPPPPAPTSPTPTASSNITVSITGPVWPGAPAASDATPLAFEVGASTVGNVSGWRTVIVDGAATTAEFSGFPTFTFWEFRVRAQTAGGWTGWSAASVSARTWSACGDGARHLDEDCDVGGSPDEASALGCVDCSVTGGYSCVGGSASSPDSCGAGCGDGGMNGIEECDDSDNVNDDGCDAACRLELGWECSSNEAGGLTSGCATTCGDGIKAGVEECDSGSDNSDTGHGCRLDCTLDDSALCTEDDGQLSTCRVCGNGKREAGELCDDAGASGGCLVSAACLVVTPGWQCSGGGLSGADSCVGGPGVPQAPTLASASTSSLTFAFLPPNSYGTPLTRFDLKWEAVSGIALGGNGFSGNATVAGTLTQAQVTSLTTGGVYRARVRACSAAGCSVYSGWSATSALSAPAAVAGLTAMVGQITSNPGALVAGLNVTVGNITADAPLPEPVAPTAENEAGVRNETLILEQNIVDNNPDTPETTANATAEGTTAEGTPQGDTTGALAAGDTTVGGAATTALQAGTTTAGGARPATTPIPTQAAATTTPVGSFYSVTVDKTVTTAVFLSSGQGVNIPAGALDANIAISVAVDPNPPPVSADKAAVMTSVSDVLTFSPSGTVFLIPVEVVISFSRAAAAGKRLAIHRYNSATLDWDEKPGSTVDAAAGTVTAETMSFSSYGIFEVPPMPVTTPEPSTDLPLWGILFLSIGAPLLVCLVIALVMWSRHTFAIEQARLLKEKQVADATAILGSRAVLNVPETHQLGSGEEVRADVVFRDGSPVPPAPLPGWDGCEPEELDPPVRSHVAAPTELTLNFVQSAPVLGVPDSLMEARGSAVVTLDVPAAPPRPTLVRSLVTTTPLDAVQQRRASEEVAGAYNYAPVFRASEDPRTPGIFHGPPLVNVFENSSGEPRVVPRAPPRTSLLWSPQTLETSAFPINTLYGDDNASLLREYPEWGASLAASAENVRASDVQVEQLELYSDGAMPERVYFHPRPNVNASPPGTRPSAVGSTLVRPPAWT